MTPSTLTHIDNPTTDEDFEKNVQSALQAHKDFEDNLQLALQKQKANTDLTDRKDRKRLNMLMALYVGSIIAAGVATGGIVVPLIIGGVGLLTALSVLAKKARAHYVKPQISSTDIIIEAQTNPFTFDLTKHIAHPKSADEYLQNYTIAVAQQETHLNPLLSSVVSKTPSSLMSRATVTLTTSGHNNESASRLGS